MRRIATCTMVLATGLLWANTALVGGQSGATTQPAREATPFRIGVDAVRIDAVVTDQDGRTVPDLTAADFEVRQDGKLQAVSFAQFMPVVSGPAPAATVTVHSHGGSDTSTVRDRAGREARRRAAHARHRRGRSRPVVGKHVRAAEALHTFVDRDLRPTDLVAFVRTGGAGGGLQPFTTDRRVLHSIIDGLHWNGNSRNAVEPFEAVNSWTTFSGGGPGGSAPAIDPNDFTVVNALRRSMSAAGSLGALNLVVRGARDLPGRKAIILVSEGFQLLEGGAGSEPDDRVAPAVDRLIDQATRAGVVIYSIDARGLQTGGLPLRTT